MKIEKIACFLNVPAETIIKYPTIALKAFEEQYLVGEEILAVHHNKKVFREWRKRANEVRR
jgi:hypothetical protein